VNLERPRSGLGALIGLAALAVFGAAPPASAQIPSLGVTTFQAPPDPRWREITAGDVEAAYRLLRDNDPGASPELHDLVFQRRLEDGHRTALERAGAVTSYQGYLAVLAGFANAMGDKHIWSRPTFVVNLPLWVGIIVSKHGDDWIVTDTEPPQASLKGASLISCDAIAVEDLARANLGGFRADWSIGAQQIQNAPWLLVDEGNPFISRPKTCVFEHGGKRQTVSLDWERIKRENLLPRLHQAIGAGAAGFGVRPVADGYWISLQSLMGDQPPSVVKAVESQKDALREAKFVVLDLRGNGGGAELPGRRIAVSLFGGEAVNARLGPEESEDSPSCAVPDGLFRTSQDNIDNLKFVGETFAAKDYPEVKKFIEEERRLVEAARARGKDLSGDVNCPTPPVPPPSPTQVSSLMHGRLILLTDNLCFSACLSVVGDFLALGAFQVGQTTDAATRFVDVREQYLPSGYSLFSVLQSVHPEIPYQVGPFTPALTYNGDIADTAALEKWIVDTAAPKAVGGMTSAAH